MSCSHKYVVQSRQPQPADLTADYQMSALLFTELLGNRNISLNFGSCEGPISQSINWIMIEEGSRSILWVLKFFKEWIWQIWTQVCRERTWNVMVFIAVWLVSLKLNHLAAIFFTFWYYEEVSANFVQSWGAIIDNGASRDVQIVLAHIFRSSKRFSERIKNNRKVFRCNIGLRW